MSKRYVLKAFVTVDSEADYQRVQAVASEILEIPEVEKVQIHNPEVSLEQMHFVGKLGLNGHETSLA